MCLKDRSDLPPTCDPSEESVLIAKCWNRPNATDNHSVTDVKVGGTLVQCRVVGIQIPEIKVGVVVLAERGADIVDGWDQV